MTGAPHRLPVDQNSDRLTARGDTNRPATLSGAVMVSRNELPFWEYFQEVETVPAGRETTGYLRQITWMGDNVKRHRSGQFRTNAGN